MFAILEPLDSHEGVADGLQLGLEVGILALQHLSQVGEWLDEAGLDIGGLVDGDGALVASVVLQVADLLQSLRMLSLALNQWPLCRSY